MSGTLKGDPAIEDALAALNVALRRELVESGLVSIDWWNERVAPQLEGVVSAMLRSPIHPRTFRLHESVVHVPEAAPDRPGVRGINELAASIYANAKAKGFHEYTPTFGEGGRDVRHILSWLMLIVTEVAEAAEASRVGDLQNFAEELADVCIRTFDCAHTLGIDLERAIISKIEKNAARPVKHGGKLA